MILSLIDEAVRAGARVERCCEVVGIDEKTRKRWRRDDTGDKRRGPTEVPHALTDEERRRVVETANSAEFRDMSPKQIVPNLADRGVYIASESTFYRVLRAQGLLAHRQRAKPPTRKRPNEHVATGPNQVWSWDITYLKTTVRGVYFYLYLVVDVWSRKIVGAEVHAAESGEHASRLIEAAIVAEGADPAKLVLHADNGGPMKASMLLCTLQRLGVIASFSRPHVSDDNPFSEALFRTLKHSPAFPQKPFRTLDAARAWVERFVRWYNHEHLHSGIRYVTPASRHHGEDVALLDARKHVYAAAKSRAPRRWTRSTRNWERVGAVYLNPVKHELRVRPLASPLS